jgi:hypothetical protein
MPCAGNSAETCGGSLRIDIYQSGGSVSTKKWNLLGCYTDNTSARTLSFYQSNAPSALTIEICQGLCLNEGYSYAGVEYANECCMFSFPFSLFPSSVSFNLYSVTFPQATELTGLILGSLRQQNRKRRFCILGLQHGLRWQLGRDLWWES